MSEIKKNIRVEITPQIAFKKFVFELDKWWPQEYTWSQDKLEDIYIEPHKDGLCCEVGPYGFRCDWGRVTEFIEGKIIKLKWQISPNREPIPNPDKASDLSVKFIEENGFALIEFEHFNFKNHGEGAFEYQKMMDSKQGWDYILEKFSEYCK